MIRDPMSDEQPPGQDSEGDNEADASSLNGLTNAVGIEPAEPGQDPFLGRDIGGVTIVTLIAEGGMGRVYEGLQDKPKRKVAVKVMRPGFVSREAIARFGMELEILGRLRHPSIAQIFSAGVCDVVGCQVPYFVMEYLPGALPITRYAKEKMLDIGERINLFQKVCEAVAHGHENGVVHRDLKPSNILVEPTGVPKIIDFGIARTIGDSPEKITVLTELGQLIGTLQYMSPEQVEADPAAIDLRTDVYALGVILYELLTGKRPYEISDKQIFEAARIVREQKPISPLELNRELPSAIVKVTGTCLQKNREKRYANAAELALAIGHCATKTPLTQRKDRPEVGQWRSSGWPWLRSLGLAMLAVLGIGAAYVWLEGSRKAEPDSSRPAAVPADAIFFNGTWYAFPKETANLTEATVKALKAGGRLLTIESAEENEFVAKHMHGVTWLGIGLKNGLWAKLDDDGRNQKYFNWWTDQPSRGRGETACSITPDGNGRWHDHFPGDQLHYAIEW